MVDEVKTSPANFRDYTGKRVGKLTIISRIGSNAYRRALWKALCDCGNTRIIDAVYLNQKSGPVKSCGCANRRAGTKLKKTDTTYWRIGDEDFV